jgi:hypothetical protein
MSVDKRRCHIDGDRSCRSQIYRQSQRCRPWIVLLNTIHDEIFLIEEADCFAIILRKPEQFAADRANGKGSTGIT